MRGEQERQFRERLQYDLLFKARRPNGDCPRTLPFDERGLRVTTTLELQAGRSGAAARPGIAAAGQHVQDCEVVAPERRQARTGRRWLRWSEVADDLDARIGTA